jgi:hypothetical protein
MATMATVTLDTNVFPAGPLCARAERIGITVVALTVSHREVEGSSLEEEVRALATVTETGVWGESRYRQARYGSPADAECLERALALLSNRSFPPLGQRDQLTGGQRRQLRDAMILCAHVRSHRDLLVSKDRRAFIDHGRREAIAATFGTRVMTVEEFEEHLAERERNAAV